ncbi:MAG: peptidase M10 [Ferruginibacter sp.]
MGIAELNEREKQIIIHATIILYGDASSEALSNIVAMDVASHWNEPKASEHIKQNHYLVQFNITGVYAPSLMPQDVYENDEPLNNYFRVEEYAEGNISFVDGIGSNTGYFKLDNLLNNSTTAAHEFGHTIGLEHPQQLDIRGSGTPGIMYPRGTIVDPHFQYDPAAAPATNGGTINPFTRKVLQKDIDDLHLNKLSFNKNGFAMLGAFSSVWHERHLQ